VEITLGGGSDPGGFGGIAEAAASLLGGGSSGPAWAEHLIALSLVQGLAPGVDHLDLLIAHTEGAPTAALGDSGQVSMGPRGALELVFTGQVVGIERRGDHLRRYRLANAGHTLAGTRINQSVTAMSVADALQLAAGEAGVGIQGDLGSSDPPLAQYAFDDSRSLWQHMAALVALRGARLWCDADDNIRFADALGDADPVAELGYGRDLLEVRLWQRSTHSGSVTVFGGGRGDDGFTLRKQVGPNRATGGDGAPQRFHRDGVLQSQAELTARVDALRLAGAWRTGAGELVAAGSAALAPGRTIELTSLPDGDDGRYLILASHHRLDHRDGWRTRIEIVAANAGASGLGGTLGGLL